MPEQIPDLTVPSKIEAMRTTLSNLDMMIVGLLNQRQIESHRLQMFKHQHGLSRRDPEQENKVIHRIRASNPGPMTCEALEAVYRTILQYTVAEGEG